MKTRIVTLFAVFALLWPADITAQSGEEYIHLHDVDMDLVQTNGDNEAWQLQVTFSVLRPNELTAIDVPDQTVIGLRSPDTDATTIPAKEGGQTSLILVADLSSPGLNAQQRTELIDQIGGFLAAQQNVDTSLWLVGAESPLYNLQAFNDVIKNRIAGLRPAAARKACVNNTLNAAIETLNPSERSPRVVIYVSTRPDNCGGVSRADIKQKARANGVTLYALGVRGTDANESDLVEWTQYDGFGGLYTIVALDRVRPMLLAFGESLRKRYTASWNLYPNTIGQRSGKMIVQFTQSRALTKDFVYTTTGTLSPPPAVRISEKIEYDGTTMIIGLDLINRERMSDVQAKLLPADSNTPIFNQNIGLVENFRIDGQALVTGTVYSLTVSPLGPAGRPIDGAGAAIPVTFSPRPPSVRLTGYALPQPLDNTLVVTPAGTGLSQVREWRVTLVNENNVELIDARGNPLWSKSGREIGGAVKINPADLIDISDPGTYLGIQAIDAAGKPIPEAKARSDRAIQHSRPGFFVRAQSWLNQNPLNYLAIVGALSVLLIAGAGTVRLLRRERRGPPPITPKIFDTPYPVNPPAYPSAQVTRAILRLVEPRGQTFHADVSQSPFVIGRSKDAQANLLNLGVSDVSRKHAVLTFENGQWHVADGPSQHGTQINSAGTRTKLTQTAVPLYDRDIIEIAGKVKLSFQCDDPMHNRSSASGGLRLQSGAARLAPTAGLPKGVLLDVPANGGRIGRAPSCEVVIPVDSSQGVSKEHAMLKRNGSNWVLTDLNSAYGTFVNSTRLEKGASVQIRDGAELQFGPNVKVRLVLSA
jgi:pSer/pThr/pTyr-binding forkhead associated (FHA) protein